MTKNMSQQELERMNDLSQYYRFEQLSFTEQQWVLAFITQNEYDEIVRFNALFQYEYSPKTSIEASESIKQKLDSAFGNASIERKSILNVVSVYKWVAVAVIFLTIGYAIQFIIPFHRQTTTNTAGIIRDTVQLVTYIQSPTSVVAANIASHHIQHTLSQGKQHITMTNIVLDTIPKLFTRQPIELANFNHQNASKIIQQALNEKSGNSLFCDTVLREMLVVFN